MGHEFQNFKEFLLIGEKSILEKWYQRMTENYPPEMRNFWANKEKRFTQPMPYTMAQAMQRIYREMLQLEPEEKTIRTELETLMRLSAVQSNLSPSKAAQIFFLLKEVIQEEVDHVESLQCSQMNRDLRQVNRLLDEWSLSLFDLYVQFREKIHEIQMKEVRNQMGF